MIREMADLVIAKNPQEDTLVAAIADADALIVRSSQVTAKIIRAGKNLKVIGRHGIGVDNIDILEATKCGVAVVNTPEANVISVAEHCFAAMLYLSKRLQEVDCALRKGEFAQTGSLPGLCTQLGYTGLELHKKTLGLIGTGRIAQQLAKIAFQGFGMQICGYDAYVSPEAMMAAGIQHCSSLEEICKQADFVSVHVPLTPETTNLIDRRLLGIMKPTAFLINASRGGVVNEEDLYQALKKRIIAGASVDVFAQEPPSISHPFFKLDNILVTPHMAAMTDGALMRMAQDVAAGVKAVLQGHRPQYLVNKEIYDRKCLL
jgi:D-3-phosphoglycerate dehydrogenase / 2-oxoglutarate reductase